jgi:FdhE protein
VTRFEVPTAKTVAREHPEWTPWATLLEITLAEIEEPAWSSVEIQAATSAASDAPMLDGARLVVDGIVARRWIDKLFRTSAERAPALATLARAALPEPPAVIEAAIAHDSPALEAVAAQLGVPSSAFAAVAMLAPVPWLHAVAARAGERPWCRTSCPVCGDWPTLAENRGVERERRLRCGRCGSDWRGESLLCPYCGTRDHHRLGHLVSDVLGEMRKVDTCQECRGYLKTVTTLTAMSGGEVLLQDLATVDLDVAAMGEDYRRPDQPGAAVRATLLAVPRRLTSWRRWTR